MSRLSQALRLSAKRLPPELVLIVGKDGELTKIIFTRLLSSVEKTHFTAGDILIDQTPIACLHRAGIYIDCIPGVNAGVIGHSQRYADIGSRPKISGNRIGFKKREEK